MDSDVQTPGRRGRHSEVMGKGPEAQSSLQGPAEGLQELASGLVEAGILSEPTALPGWDTTVEDQALPSAARAKSALRLRYEAEAVLIRRKIGELEEIRERLGLSQRKICQLLLVDPSAWTRWTKHGEKAPPHVFRALQWYLALEEKYPALDVNFWLSTVRRAEDPQIPTIALTEAHTSIAELKKELLELRLRFQSLGEAHLVLQNRLAEDAKVREEHHTLMQADRAQRRRAARGWGESGAKRLLWAAFFVAAGAALGRVLLQMGI